MRVWQAIGLALALGLASSSATAAPPANEVADAEVEIRGRIVEAGGSRQPVAGAVVLIVDAPADARPGQRPREPFDPDAVAWVRRVETDADGQFTIAVPPGKVRVIVIAGGYARLEQWAEATSSGADDPLTLYLRPDAATSSPRSRAMMARWSCSSRTSTRASSGRRAARWRRPSARASTCSR